MELGENIKNEADITFKNNQNIIEKLITLKDGINDILIYYHYKNYFFKSKILI